MAESYGFKNVVTSEEFHGQYPLLYPDIKRDPQPDEVPAWHEKIEAVFVVADPIPWGRDIQIICDVAQSNGKVLERATPKVHASAVTRVLTRNFRLDRAAKGSRFIFRLRISNIWVNVLCQGLATVHSPLR